MIFSHNSIITSIIKGENMLHGIIPALITPFKNGKIDEKAYREFIEWQISQGVHGLLPCGTTGESATLSHAEHEEVITICIDQANKRVPVLAGAGSNNTSEAISLTKFAKKAGVDAALHITPYYNKPSQEGLYRHFKAIHDEVDLPLIVYNVPGRTGVNILPHTVARIKNDMPNVVGIKEATGSILQMSDVIEQCGRDFTTLSGDDFLLLPALSLGAKGVISVTANVAPKLMVDLYNSYQENNFELAKDLHFKSQELHRTLFIDVNPTPTKAALALMGKITPEIRLPLCELDEKHLPTLKKALASVGINV